ncbi:MAG: 3'-5' exonuclease [Vulcanimicrobiaceae bacterium]
MRTILGPHACGKTTALIERIEAARRSTPAGVLLVTSPVPTALAILARRLAAMNDVVVASLDDVAYDLLCETARIRGLPMPERLDEVGAQQRFLDAAQPLVDLQWPELQSGEIDPEVPGLRTPRRFLTSAYRLACKLREAGIGPDAFTQSALSGAATFYANPPNFSHPELLRYTKREHHASLNVDADELRRQYRREVDLVKILAGLYRADLAAALRTQRLSTRDILLEAAAHAADRTLGQAQREKYAAAFVDDAHELTAGQLGFLRALFGDGAVTLAGNPECGAAGFRGAVGARVFSDSNDRLVLEPPSRRASRAVRREATPRDEAAAVAAHVRGLIDAGCAPREIAVILRSLDVATLFEQALLEAGIPVCPVGDLALFDDPRALDAIAVLWNIWDPFRHDYLLRTLSAPAFGLNDASLALLCAEPADGQTALFGGAPSHPRASRRDAQRDLRLGWNVLRGTQDAQLSAFARRALERLRNLRKAGLHDLAYRPLRMLARNAWNAGLARVGEANSAPARAQGRVLALLLRYIEGFETRRPGATLGDLLEEIEQRRGSTVTVLPDEEQAVRITDVGATLGCTFEHVVIAAVQPGIFPRWYAPDGFLFSPQLGMIARENVGDAGDARTAKFSYYMYKNGTRDRYNEAERAAFLLACSRAKTSTLITASGKPTRGVSAPEFLQELR